MDVLAQLAAVNPPTLIRVKGRWRSFDRSEEWEATVNNENQTWSATELTSTRSVSFANGLVHTERDSYPSETYRSRAPAVVLQMLIPEHLSVWGRRSDPLFPVSLTDFGERQKLLTVQHRDESAVLETLVLDMDLGIVTKYFGMLSATVIEVQEVVPPNLLDH